MAETTVYCASCSEQKFKLDDRTVRNAGITYLTCPLCGKLTTVGYDERGAVHIMAGAPKPRDAKP
jgi:hypothetical protein